VILLRFNSPLAHVMKASVDQTGAFGLSAVIVHAIALMVG